MQFVNEDGSVYVENGGMRFEVDQPLGFEELMPELEVVPAGQPSTPEAWCLAFAEWLDQNDLLVEEENPGSTTLDDLVQDFMESRG